MSLRSRNTYNETKTYIPITSQWEMLTWKAALIISSDFAWSLSKAYTLSFVGLYVTIYLSSCNQTTLQLHRLIFDYTKGRKTYWMEKIRWYLEQRFYSNKRSRFLKRLPKSWSCKGTKLISRGSTLYLHTGMYKIIKSANLLRLAHVAKVD